MNLSRLEALRAEMARLGLDGFIVPRADEHLGEYVPANAERLLWLTGFSGSAGLAVVLADRAAVFTDGRYVLQLAAQTDPALWEQRHIAEEPPPAWIAAHAPGGRIGYDPLLISEDGLRRFTEAGVEMRAVAGNPIDAVWTDRPPPPLNPAVPQPLDFAGWPSEQKRGVVAEVLRAAKQDAAVLTDPASIAWLLNIRGSDVPYTPFVLGFALIHADASCELFMAAEKLPAETRAWLGNAVTVLDRAELSAALGRMGGKTMRVDGMGSPVWFAQRLRAAGAEVVAEMDPCLLPKARKNETEQQGARDAHGRDAVAMCRFLAWLDQDVPDRTEMSAAQKLLELRQGVAGFRGESFSAISGAGEDGAIIHYRVTEQTDRPLRANEPYLIDSGGQYADGTTDITRTVWIGQGAPPEALRDHFTRVLKGHIAVATLMFPQGLTGAHIDGFARAALWQVGLDYDHGTGHGVGSYLSVHEGPVSLSRLARPVALAEGMILSDEPGYYAPGRYGIRLENLLLVRHADIAGAGKPFLRFETLTLAPFDQRLLAPALLTAMEMDWLDAYHARVLAEIGPRLGDADRTWLATACAPLRT